MIRSLIFATLGMLLILGSPAMAQEDGGGGEDFVLHSTMLTATPAFDLTVDDSGLVIGPSDSILTYFVSASTTLNFLPAMHCAGGEGEDSGGGDDSGGTGVGDQPIGDPPADSFCATPAFHMLT